MSCNAVGIVDCWSTLLNHGRVSVNGMSCPETLFQIRTVDQLDKYDSLSIIYCSRRVRVRELHVR
ncbi:hypothetical protein BCEN4_90002 [Burkholderia cenocepacia]|nr:hypothetical protein BCEN4_90002 [Burkholderia cenocepacia]